MADKFDSLQEGGACDVAIIGAGPAGLTAGLYAARAGLKASMFEQISPGGQLAQTERMENYPGFPEGTDGFNLAFSMYQQAERFGAALVSEQVVSLDVTQTPMLVETAGKAYRANSIVIASGARPRKLGVAGEDELSGHGVSYCATCDGNFFRGQTVVVVGGGDTAVADALYLSRICEKVYIVHRRDTLRATAVYHDRLAALPNVEFVWNGQVRELESEDGLLCGVKVEVKGEAELRRIPCRGLFVAVGTRPNTEFLPTQIEFDSNGYVVTDEVGRTNVDGVFAAGDVRVKTLRQVVTAVSDGALCADAAAEFLAKTSVV